MPTTNKYANFAWGTLANQLLSTDHTITLTAGHGARFPSPGANEQMILVVIDASNNREIIKATSRSTDTITIPSSPDGRAQEGTTALTFAAGCRVALRCTAAQYDQFIQKQALAAGLVKSDGSGTISAAVSGTDYAPATSGSAILKGDGAGGTTSAVSGTDYQAPIGTISGLAKGNGANALTAAVSGTDYAPPTSGADLLKGDGAGGTASAGAVPTGMVKGNGAVVSAASDGTDYLSPSTGIKQGLHTIYIPAAGMTSRTTSGASVGVVETTTNKVMLRTLDFADGATVYYAQFAVRMPKSWDEGTVTAAFTWTANSTSTNSAVWQIRGVALSDGDTIDAAFGTAQAVADANTATAYQAHMTAATSSITIAGSPAAEDWVVFEVFRDPTHASDNLATTALLLGVTLYYTVSGANDA